MAFYHRRRPLLPDESFPPEDCLFCGEGRDRHDVRWPYPLDGGGEDCPAFTTDRPLPEVVKPPIGRWEPGSRFEVVDADDPPEFAELMEVTLKSRDGSELVPSPGSELMVPDAADLTVFRGVPIEQVRSITTDGRSWIGITAPKLSLPPGQGKVLTARVSGGKGLEVGDLISVPALLIIAFTLKSGS